MIRSHLKPFYMRQTNCRQTIWPAGSLFYIGLMHFISIRYRGISVFETDLIPGETNMRYG